ncbi:runt [Aphelenchoides avenae]|nr:runt [Aphelenchus avenae]
MTACEVDENCEVDLALRRVTESLDRLAGACAFRATGNPYVFCTELPSHWRSNKSLPKPFVVLILLPVPDGTKVSVSAGNDEPQHQWAEVKNNVAEVHSQMARFSDLRFVGRSGRGKTFNLTVTLHTNPLIEVITVPNTVKVTVDGPRDSRTANKYYMQENRKRLAYELPCTSQLDFANAVKRARYIGFPGVMPGSIFPTHFQRMPGGPPLIPGMMPGFPGALPFGIRQMPNIFEAPQRVPLPPTNPLMTPPVTVYDSLLAANAMSGVSPAAFLSNPAFLAAALSAQQAQSTPTPMPQMPPISTPTNSNGSPSPVTPTSDEVKRSMPKVLLNANAHRIKTSPIEAKEAEKRSSGGDLAACSPITAKTSPATASVWRPYSPPSGGATTAEDLSSSVE